MLTLGPSKVIFRSVWSKWPARFAKTMLETKNKGDEEDGLSLQAIAITNSQTVSTVIEKPKVVKQKWYRSYRDWNFSDPDPACQYMTGGFCVRLMNPGGIVSMGAKSMAEKHVTQ
jgi:hypothetical protein